MSRRVVLSVGMSIDGYIARLDGSVDFLFMPDDYSMAPFFKTIDTAIMGRKTWDASLKLGGGNPGQIETYVLSRTMQPLSEGKLHVVNEEPEALVRRLQTKQGKNIWLMGGGEITRDLLRFDLVDELYLGVVPVLVGEGIPAFPSSFPQANFKLVESKTFSRGLVTLRYERDRL